MTRGRAVIVQDGAVALIERRKNGKHYFVFPGGGVDPGESVQAATRREVLEELGLEIDVGALIAKNSFHGESNEFYLATVTGGEFGSGTGIELSAAEDSRWGSYRPMWVPLADVPRLKVLPKNVAAYLTKLVG